MAAWDAWTMTTAVDTNVVIALWDKDAALSSAAQNALEAAFNRGNLVAAAPVFAELIAAPGRTETFVGSFFADTGESCKADMPTSANDPAVVCILSTVASTGEPTTATVLW